MKVLIVEDNEILSKNITKFLSLEGIEVVSFLNGKQALHDALIHSYDVIVLDINLWDISGLEICSTLRQKEINTPILMLTALSMMKNKIEGLEMWADDYMTKPFDYYELLARLKVLVRRNQTIKSNMITYGDIVFDDETKKVYKKNVEVALTSVEYNLFSFLLKNKGRVFSKEELLEKVWGNFDAYMFSRTVDVYISYLRKKLWKEIITTKKWIWYVIE